MQRTNEQQIATFTHISALSQFLIPFGNFILPIVIWTSNRERSAYIDQQGKECINFQLSSFLYLLICALVAVPTFLFALMSGGELHRHGHHFNMHHMEWSFTEVSIPLVVAIVAVILAGLIKAAEVLLTIYAAVKTSGGDDFRYPATIRFLK
ncbi:MULTISPECIES: DUF4870 domain-containing protein [unclassified Flavobacterium]|uniref:DUF4870 domain-containing protein n=1 Tax=unclassified Flavobacterium TaxID=196869 RepID=UPI001F139F6A|nr:MULTISPECIES: DUF4870 domain-containing protein [unclassified Flavobacterium]UMY65669.1 DUF4870 domain-containing protein [Flavobacterium sp. HJ-32-4]